MKKGNFKGRVIEINGTKIIIDVKSETRKVKTDKGEELLVASWDEPKAYPKIGDIVRGIFRVKEK